MRILMENALNIEEKRRFNRADANLALQYRNLRKSNDPLALSVSRNISEGGVCFTSSEFISLACRLVVEISLPNAPKPVKAISKVAWIRKLPAGDQYQLGNQFLEMTKEDKAHIMNFVSRALEATI